MNFGAEPKKLALLICVVLLGGGAVYYMNSDDSAPTPAPRPVVTAAQPVPVPGVRGGAGRGRAAQGERRQVTNRGTATAWNIRMGSQNPEDRPDPATIDPALKLDLLAKVQNVELGAPGRNLFVFGIAPPPPVPAGLPKVPTIAVKGPVGPNPSMGPPVPTGPTPVATPQAPPITLKYYGYKITRTDGRKAAFLLDGEDILIGGENDIVKKHYRIVKINPASIVIEDTDFKTSQTLQLQESTAG